MNKQKLLAQLSMVVTTMIWGITFVMVKEALNDAPPYMFASLRFGVAFILGCIYVNKGIKDITPNEMYGGLICGFCLFVGYAFQNLSRPTAIFREPSWFGMYAVSQTRRCWVGAILQRVFDYATWRVQYDGQARTGIPCNPRTHDSP